MDKTVAETLEKIIDGEIEIVIGAILVTLTVIKPDKTADHQYKIDEIFKKAMHATTDSIWLVLAKRREYHPDQNELGAVVFRKVTSETICDDLNKIISNQTAFDAAVFLGKLVGMYIKTCPKEFFRRWAEASNGRVNPDEFFITWTLAGHILMCVNYR